MKTRLILMTVLLQAANVCFANNEKGAEAATAVNVSEKAPIILTEDVASKISHLPQTLELTTKALEVTKRADWGDEDDDEFKYSRRLRRFHNTNASRGEANQRGGGNQRFGWGYFDPFYTSDVYYTINTPVWNNYFYQQPVMAVTRPSLFWAIFGLNVYTTTYYYAPTYYNPMPYYGGGYGWGGWNCGWNHGWNNGFYNGYNQGFNNGYYNGYNQGYWDGYNQGYGNGMYGGYGGNGYGGGYGYGGEDWWWKQQNNSNNNSQNGNFANGNNVQNPIRPDKNPNLIQNANSGSAGGFQTTSQTQPIKNVGGVKPATNPSFANNGSQGGVQPVKEVGGVKNVGEVKSTPSLSNTQPVKDVRDVNTSTPSKPKWNTDTYQDNIVKGQPVAPKSNPIVSQTPNNSTPRPTTEPVKPSFNGNQPSANPVKGSTTWNNEPKPNYTNPNSFQTPKPAETPRSQGTYSTTPRPTEVPRNQGVYTPKPVETPRNQGNTNYSTPKNGQFSAPSQPEKGGYNNNPSFSKPQNTQPTRPKYENAPIQNGNFGKQPNTGGNTSSPSQWNSTPRATQNGQHASPKQGESSGNSHPRTINQSAPAPKFEPRSNNATPSHSGGFDKAPRPANRRGGLSFETPFEVVP